MSKVTNEILIKKLILTAHLFRLGQEAQGSQQFRECIDHLEPIMNVVSNSHLILEILPNALEAQERHNWLGLADYLEYELPRLLAS